MVKRFVIIFFLITTSVSANSDCKYYAEADVVNDKIINKKERYTCKEKDNFFVTFITDEKYHHALTMSFLFILENL